MVVFVAFSIMIGYVYYCTNAYIIKNDDGGAASGGYTFWKELRPKTFHGVCAEVYGKDDKWVVIRTYGVNKDHGSMREDEQIVKTMDAAYKIAEEHCPTSK